MVNWITLRSAWSVCPLKTARPFGRCAVRVKSMRKCYYRIVNGHWFHRNLFFIISPSFEIQSMFAAIFSSPWMRCALTSKSKCRLVVSMQNLLLCVHCSVAWAENDTTRIPLTQCANFFFFSLLLWFSLCRDLASVRSLSFVCYNDDDNNDANAKHQRREWWRQPWASFRICIEMYCRIQFLLSKKKANEFISLLRTDLLQRFLQLEFT